jgi:alkylation response protein AidB-like acyl-CoA dehydrogenase
MIDFSLTAEQKRYVELAREFSAREIRPVALQYDAEPVYPEAILKQARALGLLYTNIPEAYGGAGMDFVSHYVVTEALNYDCCAIGQMIGIAHLATGPILIGATEAQKKKFLAPMTAGHRSACFCLTEPGAGSDAAAMQTKVEKKGDKYILNGPNATSPTAAMPTCWWSSPPSTRARAPRASAAWPCRVTHPASGWAASKTRWATAPWWSASFSSKRWS